MMCVQQQEFPVKRWCFDSGTRVHVTGEGIFLPNSKIMPAGKKCIAVVNGTKLPIVVQGFLLLK